MPQRESDREGQVEEGVRVALLKLVTDRSRPIGEISESCRKTHKQFITLFITLEKLQNLTFTPVAELMQYYLLLPKPFTLRDQ